MKKRLVQASNYLMGQLNCCIVGCGCMVLIMPALGLVLGGTGYVGYQLPS